MRRIVAWFLDGLPFDPRSRRAIDETMLDWDHEEEFTRTLFGRFVVQCRALASIARVAALGAFRDAGHASYRDLLARLAMVSAVPALMLGVWTYVALPPEWYRVATPFQRLELSLLPVLHEFEILIPILLFVAMTLVRRRGGLLTVGHAISVTLAVSVLVLLLEPWSNTEYLRVLDRLWRIAQPQHTSWTWAPGQTLVALYSPISRHHEAVFFGLVAFKVGLACLAGAMVLLAASMSAVNVRLPRAALLSAPLVYVGALDVGMGLRTGAIYFVFARWLGVAGVVTFGAALVYVSVRAVRSNPWVLAVPFGAVAIRVLLLPDDWLFLYRVLLADKVPIVLATAITFVAARRLRAIAREHRDVLTSAPGVTA